jgi:hypothetical protein
MLFAEQVQQRTKRGSMQSDTLEKSEVQEACNNATAKGDLDVLVIATNTQFSNPTRDWVKDWQKTHRSPKVKLWDKEHLERLLSRHPAVVLRLFSDALSAQGQVQAMEARFWNRLEYSPPGQLEKIWSDRDTLEFTEMSVFAAIAGEFSSGSITKRPWAAILETNFLIKTLHMAFLNVSYLVLRSVKSGTDQTPMIRAACYLLMAGLQHMEPEAAEELVNVSLYRGNEDEMPEEVRSLLLMPIIDQLLSELQDVCSDDCRRMSAVKSASLTQSADEIATYWERFDLNGSESDEDEQDGRRLLLEMTSEPCKVGFTVNSDISCPLFGVEPTIRNLAEVLGIAKRVLAFRKSEATAEA